MSTSKRVELGGLKDGYVTEITKAEDGKYFSLN